MREVEPGPCEEAFGEAGPVFYLLKSGLGPVRCRLLVGYRPPADRHHMAVLRHPEPVPGQANLVTPAKSGTPGRRPERS